MKARISKALFTGILCLSTAFSSALNAQSDTPNFIIKGYKNNEPLRLKGARALHLLFDNNKDLPNENTKHPIILCVKSDSTKTITSYQRLFHNQGASNITEVCLETISTTKPEKNSGTPDCIWIGMNTAKDRGEDVNIYEIYDAPNWAGRHL